MDDETDDETDGWMEKDSQRPLIYKMMHIAKCRFNS
jgi:hypothetical protein